jgi:alkanesulfonate monooxygenase SsuD/methylene tetrahydromethanopterin reductase-like flavin-dependent oxidoreductase (luciferase family)
VVGVPYRNPALLAKIWTTLDVISAGRAIVGLGAGWNEGESEAYGYEFGTVGERMDKLEDAARIADAMMRESLATYEGKRH